MADGVRLGVFLVLVGFRARAAGFGVSTQREVVPLQFSIQRSPADAEHFARESFVSVSLLKDTQDCHLLHFCQSGGRKGIGFLRSHLARGWLLGANGWRQVVDIDQALIAKCDRASDAIL